MPELLIRLLFEDFWLLLAILAAGLAVVLAIHRRRLTPGSRLGLWGAVGVGGLLLVVQYLVRTDREQLTALVGSLVRAVDAGDLEVIGELTNPDGVRVGRPPAGLNCGHQQFLDMALVGLQQCQVDEAGYGRVKVMVEGDRATVSFTVSCDLRHDGRLETRSPSYWSITCVRRPAGWRLDGINSGRLGIEGFADGLDLLPFLRELVDEVERESGQRTRAPPGG